MRNLKKLFIIIIMLFLAEYLTAQQKIQGVVRDELNLPLPGVAILEKGTSNGTLTDMDGAYTITLQTKKPTLIFSFIGFESQNIEVISQNVVNVLLKGATEGLNEVIVVGYGKMKKSDLTGAVGSIDSKQLERYPKVNIVDALQGQVAGVSVRANSNNAEGTGTSVLIRGQNSISASNNPLMILDGIPYSGNMSEINPADVASIEVLKDASSAAIYGSRGANGVILITTKRGKMGKPIFTFDTYYRLDEVGYYPKMMNGKRFGDAKVTYGESLTNIEQKNYDAGQSTDWLDLVTQSGYSQQYNLSLKGASDKVNYYISTGFSDTKGIVIGDNFKRINFRINLEAKIADWITYGTSTQIGYYDRDGLAADVDRAFDSNPLGDPYKEDGSYTFDTWEDAFWATNPLTNTTGKNNNDTWRIITNNYFDIKVPSIEGLSYKLNLGYNYSHRQYERYYGRDTKIGNLVNGELYDSYQYDKDWIIENILSYNKTFGKHALFLTGLYSAQETSYQFNTVTGIGFPNDLLGYYQQSKATTLTGDSNYSQSNNISQMFRANYTFDSKYLFTFTVRRDGFSGFGDDTKFGVFPSVAVGWNLTNEKFFQSSKSLSFIDQLKLRMSYGKNGNQAISPYSTLAQLYSQDNLDENHKTLIGYYPQKLSNPKLGWETTKSFNIGTDFSLWKNRLSGSIDVYSSRTTDLLLNKTIPVLNGTDQITENIGETKNRGIDLSLSSTNISNSNFSWKTNLTFTKYQNEIVQVGLTDENGNYIDDVASRWFIGKPINVNYDYVIDGVWQVEDFKNPNIPDSMKAGYRPGDMRYKDVDGDGDVDANDQDIIGSAVPSFTAGMTNIFTYKNFSFSFFLNCISGIDRRNGELGNFVPQLRNVYDRIDYWTAENTNTKYPKNTPGSNKYDTDYFDDASFVRLQDITLSYDLDKNLLQKNGISSLQLYVNLKNIHTWTEWKEVDPEYNSTQSGPMPKSFLLGLKMSF
jgi:TonB-linked SusC/RagA family outer membrane protein